MRTRGFILINVLIIVGALSVVALALVQISAQSNTRQQAGHDLVQARLALDAGVLFAAQLLEQDAQEGIADHRGEAWALDSFPAQTALGTVTVSTNDLESRFNLNLLLGNANSAAEASLQTMLQDAGVETGLAAALLARYGQIMRPGDNTEKDDAGNMFQSGDLTHMAGLAAVASWDQTTAAALADRVAPLPRSRKVNINTASDAVLAALSGMTPVALDAINAKRETAPFTDLATLGSVLQDLGLASEVSDLLGIDAQWFAVETSVTLNGLRYNGQTILQRDADTGNASVFSHHIKVDG